MAQNKKTKISKSQEIRYQYTRQLIEAGEIDTLAANSVAYPQYFTEDQHIVVTNTTVTYPWFITSVRPKREREREQTQIQVNAAGNWVQSNAAGNHVSHNEGIVVAPVLYSLAYRKEWKKIADNYNNRS